MSISSLSLGFSIFSTSYSFSILCNLKGNTKINCSSRFKGMHDVSPIGKYSGTKNKRFMWLIYTATLIASYFLEFEIHFFYFNDSMIETFASEDVFEFPTFELCTSVQLSLFLPVTETNETDTKSIRVYIYRKLNTQKSMGKAVLGQVM